MQQSITVTASSGLTEEEIRQMTEEAEEYAVGVKQTDAFDESRLELDALLRDIDTLVPKVEPVIAGSDFGQDALRKVSETVERAKNAISSGSKEAVDENKSAVERTLKMLQGVAQKLG